MNNQTALSSNQTDLISFGRFIQSCRKHMNIKRDVLAKFLDMNKGQLHNVECGQESIDPRKFAILSGVLAVDVREIHQRYYDKCA